MIHPRARPEGSIAFTNATILTMQDANAGVIEDGVVVVQQDRIIAVGGMDTVTIPSDAQTIDMEGKFILPGYIDTHAHFRTARQVAEPYNWSFLANLAYGVTTGMDVQPSTIDLISAKDAIDAGLTIGPRAFNTGPGVFNNNEFKSKDHAYAVLKRYKDHYKINNIKAYISGSRKQRQWLIQAARELELMPTTEGALDMKLDVTHVIDGFSGLEHAYPLPTLYTDIIEISARTKLAYTPTLLVTYSGPSGENYFFTQMSPFEDPKLRRFTPHDWLSTTTLRRNWFHPKEYVTQEVANSARKIIEAGGQVGVGAHGQLQGLGYHWELWALASGNMTTTQALFAATLMGAQMIGVDQDLGSIAPGKLADMVILNKDPLQNIKHSVEIHQVMKGGVLYDGATLDQVLPQQQPLPDQWWWQQGPSLLRLGQGGE